VVETKVAVDADGLAEALTDIAQRSKQVAIKRTRCASAMGNKVYDAAAITAMSPSALVESVQAFLTTTEWPQGEPVLAVAWEDTDCSPSTQMWIPPPSAGEPRLDGIYEQLLEGEEKVFLGSQPSTLPEPVEAELARVSMQACLVLQHLGYRGRCSFDFLVVGDLDGDFVVKVTESNGRWGGTSTPMHVMDRIFGRRPRYLAQDFVHEALVGTPFMEILRRVGDAAYDVRTGKGRFVFYNTGCLDSSGKFDVIALGDDPKDAQRAAREVLPGLLGL
jgi:hypothetical protein